MLDLLYVILIICIAILTFFICWSLFYATSVLKKLDFLMDENIKSVAWLKENVSNFFEKASGAFNYLAILTNLAKEATSMFFRNKRDSYEELQDDDDFKNIKKNRTKK